MNLPDGIKHALQMGANEAFMEWVDMAGDDPEGALEGLGSSYQEVMSEDMISEDDVERYIADLAAWDDGGTDATHGQRVMRFERLMCDAGIEFARGMICEAANVGEVPDRVKPYMKELAPMIAELKKAFNESSFDESSYDINEAIWG